MLTSPQKTRKEKGLPEVKPFRGIRYNTERVKIEEVVAPPYDVISNKARRLLLDRNPYNVVRLILPQGVMGDDKYSQANLYLKRWLSEGILVRDEKPSFYILEETFTHQAGERTRVGFIGLLKLRELGHGVFPHENTIGKVKKDRFRLLEACRANFSQIFMIYSDRSMTLESIHREMIKRPPIIELRDDEGVYRKMWMVEDGDIIDTLSSLLREKDVVIADGHHRYETALEFMKTMDKRGVAGDAHRYTLAYFTNALSEGVISFPTHRLIGNVDREQYKSFLDSLKSAFSVKEYPFTPEDKYEVEKRFLKDLKKEGFKSPAIGFISTYDTRYYLVSIDVDKAKKFIKSPIDEDLLNLDVVVLNELILPKFLNMDLSELRRMEDIRCTSNPYKAVDCVMSGRYQIAFLLNPIPVERILNLAVKGLLLPQKSTFFYPKLLSGLVMRVFE